MSLKTIIAGFALGISIFMASCGTEPKVEYLSPIEFDKAMGEVSNPIILDVRTADEFQSGKIEGAINLNVEDEAQFAEELNKLNKNQPVFVYCKSGARGEAAVNALIKAGFTKVHSLNGGLMAWEKENLPVEKGLQGKPGVINSVAELQSFLQQHSSVVVDFYAPWCPPCRQMEPHFDKLKGEYEGKVTVLKINVDDAPNLSKELGIESIPVIKVFKNGKELRSELGYQTEPALRTLFGMTL